ncbi:MAG: DUF938 domain-containing protein [Cyanobacteria bacterium SBC]|nr:DUF938 domain-containing protein [Cyanobacteria bacterium SBC]
MFENIRDDRQFAPATVRNREPILGGLRRVLPQRGTVLEVASGTGEHAVFFAPRLKPRFWLPSDPDPSSRVSIAAWRDYQPVETLLAPIDLDTRDPEWAQVLRAANANARPPVPELARSPICSIVCINMIHIAPWSAGLGLMAGAGQILPPGGILYLYGPFKENGQHTSPSNVAFDSLLRDRDPSWGVRDLEQVVEAAAQQGLQWQETVEMPANNRSVVFCRT